MALATEVQAAGGRGTLHRTNLWFQHSHLHGVLSRQTAWTLRIPWDCSARMRLPRDLATDSSQTSNTRVRRKSNTCITRSGRTNTVCVLGRSRVLRWHDRRAQSMLPSPMLMRTICGTGYSGKPRSCMDRNRRSRGLRVVRRCRPRRLGRQSRPFRAGRTRREVPARRRCSKARSPGRKVLMLVLRH